MCSGVPRQKLTKLIHRLYGADPFEDWIYGDGILCYDSKSELESHPNPSRSRLQQQLRHFILAVGYHRRRVMKVAAGTGQQDFWTILMIGIYCLSSLAALISE
jgi:hypothetical protein